MATTATAIHSLLVERVKLVITCPVSCWQTIAPENRTPRELFTSISLPLLVLGAVSGFVGMRFFSAPGAAPSVLPLLQHSLLTFLLSCAMPFISAFVLTHLAPFFQGSIEYDKAFSWSVHSSIPVLAAKLLSIVPLFGLFASLVAACWSLHTGYAGLPTMASVPKHQQLALFLSFVVAMLILFVLLAALLATLLS